MNRKIFTLLVGALILVSSVLTVNAQVYTPKYAQPDLPYTQKSFAGETNFNDLLTASLITPTMSLSGNSNYLLSVTGIANPDPGMITALNTYLRNQALAENNSLVMYIDNESPTVNNLRLDWLWMLGHNDYYDFKIGESHKFGALRRTLWCATPTQNVVPGSNVTFSFKQMETGIPLLGPSPYDRNIDHNWTRSATDVEPNEIFSNGLNPGINTLDPVMIVDQWHFSQTYTNNIQQNMPLFAYTSVDSVIVLVLEDGATDHAINPTPLPGTSGGWVVTAKHVAVADLIAHASGYVNDPSTPYFLSNREVVHNVLLFSLKKVNKFVMNADDWNAFNDQISFTLDANLEVTNGNPVRMNSYTNPFLEEFGYLNATEVNDSLYHYGYMQFERQERPLGTNPLEGDFLFVDTAFVNYGKDLFVAFAWDLQRDNTDWAATTAGVKRWGDSFTPSLSCATPLGGVLDPLPYLFDCGNLTGVWWKLDSLIWATLKRAEWAGGGGQPTVAQVIGGGPPGSIYIRTAPGVDLIVEFTAEEADDWNATVDYAVYYGLIPAGDLPNNLTATAGTPYVIYTTGADDYPNADLGNWAFGTHYNLEPAFTFNIDLNIYGAERALWNSYINEASTYLWIYMKDSIMENQSKFRVVYDPFVDSTWINVYQSRIAYPNYVNGQQNAIWPAWWTNSFGMKEWTTGNTITAMGPVFTRPQDLFVGQLYDGTPITGYVQRTITEAAGDYFNQVLLPDIINPSNNPLGPFWTDWWFEGHGNPTTPTPVRGDRAASDINLPSIFNIHSFMEFYPQSSDPGVDRVMISTADTCRIWYEFDYGFTNNFSALAHTYGWSTTTVSTTTSGGTQLYKDSLLYVDLQSLQGTVSRIVTLDQSYRVGAKQLDTKIGIYYGDRCTPTYPDDKIPATLENDLYLIRAVDGRYLNVPLWSISDSIYWTYPEPWEDPTKMPSYQWALMNIRQNSNGSPFRIVNREFEHVDIPYMFAFTTPQPFEISGDYRNATFNTSYGKGSVIGKMTPVNTALQFDDIRFKTITFAEDVEKIFARNEFSFIRLGNTVKENQTLGYLYIDRDSTYIDVYAFKFLHFLTGDINPRYLSWLGYDDPKKTQLYAWGEDYYDKLYFSLEEMKEYHIFPEVANAGNKYNGRVTLTDENTKDVKHDNYQFRELYQKYASKDRQYLNADSLVMERFGFWETNTGIANLKPMARQAYRLFLQDYYRWHPTIKGNYVVVGEQDRYIMLDKNEAGKPYVAGSGSLMGIFGIPHYYFRETFFDLNGKQNHDDYFAIVQRIDTVREELIGKTGYWDWTSLTKWADIEEFMYGTFGSKVATEVIKLVKINRENQLALLDINQNGEAKFVLRSEAKVGSNISAFQLDRDEDPIYRRFHVNEPNEKFGGDDWWGTDLPDTLEFHLWNHGDGGEKLYENAGNYLDKPLDLSDRIGADGGRTYNLDNDGRGKFYRDSLDNVISYLGMSSTYTYPKTNRAFFIDTAYINRGTGWIKPQYLIAVDPYNPVELGDCVVDINGKGGDVDPPNQPFVLARYLYNTAQYAKAPKDTIINLDFTKDYMDSMFTINKIANVKRFNSNNFNKVQPIEYGIVRKQPYGINYWRDPEFGEKFERLAFAWAIHYGDKLYVLKGIEPGYNGQFEGDPEQLYKKLVDEYEGKIGGERYLNFGLLESKNIASSYYEVYYPLGDRSATNPEVRQYHNFKTMAQVENEGRTIGLQAIIRLDDNTHKDWVFSFRYIERGSSDFVIESETAERDMRNGAIIRPGAGGWVITWDGVPVISRTDEKFNMAQAEGGVFNVKQLTNPVGNEGVNAAASAIQVIGGKGALTIINAAGKKAVITNMLGQTIANVTLSSDNASLPAPAGVVIVSVEGEKAAKVLVN